MNKPGYEEEDKEEEEEEDEDEEEEAEAEEEKWWDVQGVVGSARNARAREEAEAFRRRRGEHGGIAEESPETCHCTSKRAVLRDVHLI